MVPHNVSPPKSSVVPIKVPHGVVTSSASPPKSSTTSKVPHGVVTPSVSPPKISAVPSTVTHNVSPPKSSVVPIKVPHGVVTSSVSLPKSSVVPISTVSHGSVAMMHSPPKSFVPTPKSSKTSNVSPSVSPPKSSAVTPPKNNVTPPRMNSVNSVTQSPKRTLSKEAESPRTEAASPPKKIASPPVFQNIVVPKVTSPPAISVRTDSKLSETKVDENATVTLKSGRKEPREAPIRMEKLSLVVEPECSNDAELPSEQEANREESNGVGDKIKIFEKVAEEASAGRLSRPGSMRRPRTERLPSDELPPPPESEMPLPPPERHTSLSREPQRIVRPEFRPLASPAEVTIRSPSLGSKAPERFPSHGTAFRNVSASTPSPTPLEPNRSRDSPDEEDDKCKYRSRAAASRGSSYFTRGSEEIWLVKKKDIEEIEERVLDSFRRAGRGGTVRGRRSYARSESLEAGAGMRSGEWAGRAHTLKRQASVACTCGHDKKTRPKTGVETTLRPRSRSHGDPGDTAVLDKYETLV